MSDQHYYKTRAEAERKAALAAADVKSCQAHMAIAREYEWRAVTEPYPESDGVAAQRSREQSSSILTMLRRVGQEPGGLYCVAQQTGVFSPGGAEER
jgi:hypothetical protein